MGQGDIRRFSVHGKGAQAGDTHASRQEIPRGLAAIEEKVLTVALQVLQSLTLIEGREWLDDLLGSCAYTAIPPL
jgi:hypothetical protein